MSLAACGWPASFDSIDEIVEPEHAEPGGTLDQQVEQIGGGERVVERTMARPMVESEPRRQRAELAVGHFVAHQPSGECDGVDDGACQRLAVGAMTRRTQEADVEADVVADDHRVADEVDQASPRHRSMRGAPATRTSESPVSTVICGGMARPGFDERLERPEALATADLDGADLGDHVVVAVAAGGLEVDDAERDVVQRCAQIVERSLVGELGNRTGLASCA